MLITEENFAYAMMCLQGNTEIAVDTETSGLNTRNKVDYLMGFCFSVEGMSCYMPFRHKTDNLPLRYLDHVRQLLNEKDLIWHNAKFDYHSVKTIGIDPLDFKGKQYDTMMIAHLVNEELFSKELDFLAKWYLKDEKHKSDEVHKMGQIFGYDNLTPKSIAEYGAKDAELTRRLKEYLWPRLVAEELETVYWTTEAPFIRLLYKLEQRGVGVNQSFCRSKAELGRGRMATITRELGFNPSSPIDLGKYLLTELGLPILGHTDSCKPCKSGQHYTNHDGKATFNKRVMEEYDEILQESNNPNAQRIAEYRGWQKAVTSLYEPMLEKVGPDGLVRTEFKQHGTVTGRLSASNPNLQQVPRNSVKSWNGNAKSAFHSGREGYVLYGWDYSQIELRLAAAYGQEQVLLTEFSREGADPFNVLAPLIFGEHCAPFDRHSGCYVCSQYGHDTKTFVYANLYGAGLPKIASQLGRPLDEVKELYNRYKASISGIIGVSSQVTQLVEQRGYVKYWDGRRRHIRNKRDAYKAWNSVCQGGGAQLVKRAMIRCEEFEDDNCQMVLQVHDEITFIIKEGMIPHYEPMIIEAMTDWPEFGVKLHVEGKEWK